MKRGIMVLVLLLMAMGIAGYFTYQNFSKESQWEHNPQSNKCQVDSDCICTLKCLDCCGKIGQSWKCVMNKCELGFYNSFNEQEIKQNIYETFDIENKAIPEFVEKNFIDLDKIKAISRYRGGYGHDFSRGTGENCRSMKHYLWPAWGKHGKTHKPSWMSINYYAPIDGIIEELDHRENEYGVESQFKIKSDEYPAFYFRFFHVRLLDNLAEGSRVTAGQKIGTIGDENSHGEIAVEVKIPEGATLVSFFQVMNDQLFEEYKKRGISKRDDAIIQKEERNANPLECDYSTEAGYFIGRGTEKYDTWSTSSANWIMLN